MADSPTNRTPCPYCGAQVRLPPLPPGSNCNCPKCGKAFVVPGGSSAVDPPKPTAPPTSKPSPPPLKKPAVPPPPLPPIPNAAAVPSPYAPPPVEVVTNPLTVRQQSPAPPTSPAKPKPKLIPLNCKLCGTLMYAGLEQQGKTVRCPDCHSAVTVEIQAHKPAVDPDAPASAPRPPSAAAHTALEQPAGEEDDFQLSPEEPPPLQHADLQSALRAGGHKFDVAADGKIVLHDAPEIESAESKRRRGYDGAPEKENQASSDWDHSEAEVRTFVQGTVKFLQRPEAMMRVIAYAIGAAVLSGWLHAGVLLVLGGSSAVSQFGGLASLVSGVIAALLYTVPLAACLSRIVQGTANGQDQIDWPDAMFLDWMGEAVFIAAALVVAGAPGIAASVVLLGTLIHPWLIPIPIIASELIFLPIVLLSMIEGGSVASIFSPRVASTLTRGADGLLIFIVQSLLIMAGMFLGTLAQYGFDPIFPPLGAAVIVVLSFIYARLLGRLVWYCDVKPQKAPATEEATPPDVPPQQLSRAGTLEDSLRV